MKKKKNKPYVYIKKKNIKNFDTINKKIYRKKIWCNRKKI
jgi:hypothetical protein